MTFRSTAVAIAGTLLLTACDPSQLAGLVGARKQAASQSTPTISQLTPDNAGVGGVVTLKGTNFGDANGDTIQVSFNGSIGTNAVRSDDHTVVVSVPSGASTGNVVLTVGSLVGMLTSNGAPFHVLNSLAVSGNEATDLLLGKFLSFTVSAADTAGQSVESPTASWSIASGSSVSLSGGLVEARALGDSLVQASSGNLVVSRAIHVFKVDSLSLSPQALTLNAREGNASPDPSFLTSATLSAIVHASDGTSRAVQWRCSDPTLATVTDGRVTATSTTTGGSAVITATSLDDPTVLATASVTITTLGTIDLGVN